MNDSQALAATLARVHQAAKKYSGGNIISSAHLERADRELLVSTRWLQEIIRGWYLLARPDVQPGDTSVWYANFWDFARVYLEETYGSRYCLSAENSLDLLVANPTIPKQVVVITEKGGGKSVDLLFGTSILPYSDPNNFPQEQSLARGLRIMSLCYALCKVTPTYFQNHGTDIRIALGLVKDVPELIFTIASHKFIRAGERIISAFETCGEKQKADTIRAELKKMGFHLKGENPFVSSTMEELTLFRSPYQGRILALWEYFRSTIIDHFPPPPSMAKDTQQYLQQIEELYEKDAYNSLSIEGYHVDLGLIERVANHHWNPDFDSRDAHEKNALAARGYYEAFLEVKKAIFQILEEANPGLVIEKALQNWFQALFKPSIDAGILKQTDLLGYRKRQVFIRGSRHVPLPKEALFDAMETFFDRLKKESHPAVRAILGHFLFVYIHPYMDGNGRLSRFLMNAMLASGGYPWTIIEVKNRQRYFAALEAASVERNIEPFTLFVKQEMLKDKEGL